MTQPLSPLQRLERVRVRIAHACVRAGRDPASVTLAAVSKTHPPQAVEALARAGQALFAESYVQEALPKMDALAPLDLRWHFIGKLQKNKVKHIAGRFELIHSVDSLELAQVLHNKSSALGVRQGVLVQANLACEAAKSGCRPGDVEPLAEAVADLAGLELRGLMLMPPWDENPEANRGLFARARELRERLAARLGLALPVLSMGMSHDLETAVEEGATLVRVGTDLFGAREG